jgi:gas vesicle protein
MSEEQGSSNFLWFLTGAALGAAAAVLYTPKTGKETRQLISQKTHEGRDAITGVYDRGKQVVDDAAALFERGRKMVRG